MQKIERVEGQEMETTDQKTEVYTDRIQESISNYCIDHDIHSINRYGTVYCYIFTDQYLNHVKLTE